MTARASLVAWVALLGGACRLGGPEGSPTDLIEVDGGAPVEEPEDEQQAEIDAGADVPAPRDAGGAVAADSADGQPAAPDASPVRCTAPPGLACDPVRGEGCLPLMQCVVDAESSVAAATCVFGGIPLEDSCAQDALSTDCPPQHTCVAGKCRQYCYCDADCADGAACADPSGEGGSTAFKLCAPASP